jgi:hypothetical protein
MRALAFVAVLMTTPLIPMPLQARWECAHDNKSPAELAEETNEQLFNEAFDVCVRRALLESLPNPADAPPEAFAECNNYLDALSPAVRARNGGRMPPWMDQLMTAHTTKECQRAFRTYLGETEKPAVVKMRRSAARAHRPRPTAMPKATPAPPRSGWSEQLPPWLAPR